MTEMDNPWDYLIITASNDLQAAAYRQQLDLRVRLGLLAQAREVLVLPDVGGRRIGSGGSLLYCLLEVLRRRLSGPDRVDPQAWRTCLRSLRILIVHAGGDSRRLPAYGPCGKLFIPMPGEGDGATLVSLFDRQIPTYFALPSMGLGVGQTVMTAGDALVLFDPQTVAFAPSGMTGLGCLALPEQAAKHGVFRIGKGGQVDRFFQKPTPDQQAWLGAVNRYGQSILDIGVINFDAETAVTLLQAFIDPTAGDEGLPWRAEVSPWAHNRGVDFYNEIGCALGTETTVSDYVAEITGGGSDWPPRPLEHVFHALRGVSFHAQTVPQCEFLHFGTTRQLISSGAQLRQRDCGVSRRQSALCINNEPGGEARILGADAWVESCRVRSTLTLDGENAVIGIDVDEPTHLPKGACLDILPGCLDGQAVWFVRCYGVGDQFKIPIDRQATFCNMPVADWLAAAGLRDVDVWDESVRASDRTLWNARVFPAVSDRSGYRAYLWMFAPSNACPADKLAYARQRRYSPADMAILTDTEAFHERRASLRLMCMRRSLQRLFRDDSGFGAADLTYALNRTDDRAGWIIDVLQEAQWHQGGQQDAGGLAVFVCGRILHSLGSAVLGLLPEAPASVEDFSPGLAGKMPPSLHDWLQTLDASFTASTPGRQWGRALRAAAFGGMSRAILTSVRRLPSAPRSSLRSDEIVWGRAPARLDLGGGWSDTPPYALEHGGSVLNAAVDLNGQPPIHCYARVIAEPVIRIGSIDLGVRAEIRDLNDLLDYRSATGEFSLAKAALAISGFAPEAVDWPAGTSLPQMLASFGGGIELTTLAAIPKGSGLGTSSIVGAVILAVIHRVMGRELSAKELFHGVLRLEQALTTGGGWQDQIGGVVGAVKRITTSRGLVPDPTIHFVPTDVLAGGENGGQTLLYYSGITRLAKNILQNVVGHYLDRDRLVVHALRQIHRAPVRIAEAMARRDVEAFGRLVGESWRLNKQLDPHSTNDEVDALLARVAPHVWGAKLLGAGGGGFLLMVCKSPNDAQAVKDMLNRQPPNERARFFDFSINHQGLVVTVS